MVVGAVEVETSNDLHVGLAGKLDAHHPLLGKNDDRERRLQPKETRGQRHPALVSLRGGAVEETERPDAGREPKVGSYRRPCWERHRDRPRSMFDIERMCRRAVYPPFIAR